MSKSRVSQTISRRMARAKRRGLSYRQYMRQARKGLRKRHKPQPKLTRDRYGRVTAPRESHVTPRPYLGVFRKGSSMVGSPKRGSQLLTFIPTAKMQAQGFKITSLRFFTRKKARLMGLETRQDWINDMVQDLKSKGLL